MKRLLLILFFLPSLALAYTPPTETYSPWRFFDDISVFGQYQGATSITSHGLNGAPDIRALKLLGIMKIN